MSIYIELCCAVFIGIYVVVNHEAQFCCSNSLWADSCNVPIVHI